MAVATASRETKSVKPLAPQTRLTMTFRELAIEGRKDWRNCWTFAQFVADEGDEEMVRVMDCYRKLKRREQSTASPEFVCDLAGVSPNDFAAEIFRAYLAYAGDAANLIAAAGLPAVVRKSVAVAQTTKGVQDRKMQFDHANFLPQKSGGGIHVSANANAENQSATVISAPELVSMESDTLRYTRILKGEAAKTITEATTEEPHKVSALGSDDA
jgi:hypothetical protein